MSFGGTLLRVLVVLTCVLTSFSICEAQATPPTMPTWGHARIVDRDGDSIFEVDGKPFFLYGAAFFYERLPRDMWSESMSQLKNMGINTLDIYVPWNWHELSDGDFDFTGRTSPRRDFDEVLRLASTMDFKIVLRPGPVIRNEWRNGGYPAWLLSRPEYGMPLHDLLEGRYPPTATLQNQHSDDAAAQWMRNATHVKYARRWLERVLHEASRMPIASSPSPSTTIRAPISTIKRIRRRISRLTSAGCATSSTASRVRTSSRSSTRIR